MKSWIKVIKNAHIFLLCMLHISSINKIPRQGHLKKLGSHARPTEGLTIYESFVNPSIFYENFVKARKPLWMKSALKAAQHPGLTEWTDEFLRYNYGDVTSSVELNKKEIRPPRKVELSIREFLSIYTTEDVYLTKMINTHTDLGELILVPESLQCGGFQKWLSFGSLWLGSGETKSVLHYDVSDNLLCLIDGQKDFILIDTIYKRNVESTGFNHAYSQLDVDKVDFEKFPGIYDTPFYKVQMTKGDCLYIPEKWYHQVTSHGKRHMAVNIWFDMIYWFDYSNCSKQNNYKQLEPISKFGFVGHKEFPRRQLFYRLGVEHEIKEFYTKQQFVSSLKKGTKERKIQFFDAVDANKDSLLSWSELYGFNITKAQLKFPDIFSLPKFPENDETDNNILY